MPYDHFPRKYMMVMLAAGYNGTNASLYTDLNERGAWTVCRVQPCDCIPHRTHAQSLLLQSPWGEVRHPSAILIQRLTRS